MTAAQNVFPFSGEAGTAVTVYRAVVRAADDQYDHVGVSGGLADGVALETVTDVGGELPMAMLVTGSILKMEAGAAVSALATVQSDASGRAITHVSAVGAMRLGKALDAAAAAGEIIRVQIHAELDEVT